MTAMWKVIRSRERLEKKEIFQAHLRPLYPKVPLTALLPSPASHSTVNDIIPGIVSSVTILVIIGIDVYSPAKMLRVSWLQASPQLLVLKAALHCHTSKDFSNDSSVQQQARWEGITQGSK